MAAMSGSPLFGLSDQSARSDSRENPYLGVYSINVFVRDGVTGVGAPSWARSNNSPSDVASEMRR